MLASSTAQWPQLNSWQRDAVLQQWAIELPQMLWMIILCWFRLRQSKWRRNDRSSLANLRQNAAAGQPPALSSAQAINELNRGMQSAIDLQNFSTKMTVNTLNLMNAIVVAPRDGQRDEGMSYQRDPDRIERTEWGGGIGAVAGRR